MRFTESELVEIRDAFRRRVAAERAPRRSARKLLAVVFEIHPQTVSRWADAGVLPSFSTVGGHYRFRWSEVRWAVTQRYSASRAGSKP
jgi:hypothetical protein